MGIVLIVLKSIGIILLSLLAIILLLLLLVLFVPIRYKIDINKMEEDFSAIVKVTWLLHFLNILVKYTDDLYYIVRITIIPIFKSENLKKKPKKINKNIKNDRDEIKERDELVQSDNEDQKLELVEYSEDNNESIDIESENENDSDNEDDLETESIEEEPKKSIFEKVKIIIGKIIDFVLNIQENIETLLNKIIDIKENTDYYIDAISDERNQKVFKLCFERLRVVLNNIKPKKIKGYIEYGSDDPYNMGKMMSIYSILFPIIHDKIQLVPDYDEEKLNGFLIIKGRITVCILLWALIKIYFNRDFKRMLKIFKKDK